MDFLTVKQDIFCRNLAVVRQLAHDGIHRLAFAGAGFADDAQYLLRINAEGNITHSVNRALICGEIHGQMINF